MTPFPLEPLSSEECVYWESVIAKVIKQKYKLEHIPSSKMVNADVIANIRNKNNWIFMPFKKILFSDLVNP